MKKWVSLLAGAMSLFGLTGSTCTSTFTEADRKAEERKRNSAAISEEKWDEEIGEAGGANEEAIREGIEDVDGGSGADF